MAPEVVIPEADVRQRSPGTASPPAAPTLVRRLASSRLKRMSIGSQPSMTSGDSASSAACSVPETPTGGQQVRSFYTEIGYAGTSGNEG